MEADYGEQEWEWMWKLELDEMEERIEFQGEGTMADSLRSIQESRYESW